MNYRIILTARANRDIRSIVRWKVDNASASVAYRWHKGLQKKIGTLHTLPARCPVTEESEDLPFELRELLHGSKRSTFRILFTINDDLVSILSVRHGAQDKFDPNVE